MDKAGFDSRNLDAADESPLGRLSPNLRVNLRRSPRPLVFLLVPWLGYAVESPAPPKKKAAGEEPQGGSLVSAHIADAIRAQLPAFKPAPAPPPPPAADAGAAGTTDSPIVLERLVVTEAKAPNMGEFQMLTKVGQAAYLQKLFPGAVVPGGDPLTETQPNYASQMLRDKVRQEKLRNLSEAVETYRATGDITGSNRLKEEMQRALIRRYDWRDERLDRSYNNDRR